MGSARTAKCIRAWDAGLGCAGARTPCASWRAAAQRESVSRADACCATFSVQVYSNGNGKSGGTFERFGIRLSGGPSFEAAGGQGQQEQQMGFR